MICLDLEQIRDLWKINTDRELDHDNGSAQTCHGCRGRCHPSTFNQCTLQVSLYFKVNLMKRGTINKFCEARWCHKQLISFRESISPVFSSQTEEQRMAQKSWEWLHLAAYSYIHQSEQKCLVKSRYAQWVLGCCQHWSIWKCYRLGDLSGGSYFCLYFLNYYSNTLMKSGTSLISCLTELNFGKCNTDLR